VNIPEIRGIISPVCVTNDTAADGIPAKVHKDCFTAILLPRFNKFLWGRCFTPTIGLGS
jgi:hypothetical protein